MAQKKPQTIPTSADLLARATEAGEVSVPTETETSAGAGDDSAPEPEAPPPEPPKPEVSSPRRRYRATRTCYWNFAGQQVVTIKGGIAALDEGEVAALRAQGGEVELVSDDTENPWNLNEV